MVYYIGPRPKDFRLGRDLGGGAAGGQIWGGRGGGGEGGWGGLGPGGAGGGRGYLKNVLFGVKLP